MRAGAAAGVGHDPVEYQVVRVEHADASAIGQWDGVVVVARTDDEAADLERARKHLESLDLLACGCCRVEIGTRI